MIRLIQSNFSTFALRVIFCGFCLALFVQAGLAQTVALEEAPLNPEFVVWQQEGGHGLGYIPSPFKWSHLPLLPPEGPPLEGQPASYDLRTRGEVTGVRDQSTCGSCWAFATYGSLESWLLKTQSETWDLSENHLKDGHLFDPLPCSGGNSDMSTAYLVRWCGPATETCDPYVAGDSRPANACSPQKYLESALWFSTQTAIKNAVQTYGALYTSMCWYGALYNSEDHTYYSALTSCPSGQGHAVAIAGWDDAKVTAAPSPGAWICKNSWGTGWGEAGYFYLSYYDTLGGKSARAFCNAVPSSTTTYVTNYQYDPLGLTQGLGVGSTTLWGANIFTPSADGYLGAVGFYAAANNTSYEIKVWDDFNAGTGEFSTQLGTTISSSVTNEGYHTITLPSTISLTNGDSFGIQVKFTTPGYLYPLPTEDVVALYSSGASANAGESYYSLNGTDFTDITTYSATMNVCIKGLTVPEATLASISYFRARGLDSGVVLEWETEAEVDTAGFNVLRAESAYGPWVKLNQELIPSQGSSWDGASYDFSDDSREAGTPYWYCVEEVETGGSTQRYPAQFVWDEGLTDADGDDMPDVWEQRLAIDTGSGADASADADGDGATNLQEYLAGTSPVDAGDCPRLRIEWADGGDVPVLSWRGRAGRRYRLVTADSLAELLGGSTTVLSTRSAGSDGAMRFDNDPGAEKRTRFYRLIISPPR